jgi:hypothetical protein
LESLDTETGHRAEKVSVLVLEAVEVRSRTERASVVNLRGDFSVLFGDLRRIDVDSEDASESDLSLFVFAGSDQVARRFGKEEESDSENDSPGELETDRNSVRTEIVAVKSGIRNQSQFCASHNSNDLPILGSVHDNSGNEKTDSNHPL